MDFSVFSSGHSGNLHAFGSSRLSCFGRSLLSHQGDTEHDERKVFPENFSCFTSKDFLETDGRAAAESYDNLAANTIEGSRFFCFDSSVSTSK